MTRCVRKQRDKFVFLQLSINNSSFVSDCWAFAVTHLVMPRYSSLLWAEPSSVSFLQVMDHWMRAHLEDAMYMCAYCYLDLNTSQQVVCHIQEWHPRQPVRVLLKASQV